MPFSNAADANVFLDGTTLLAVDGQIDDENSDAEALIRAYLTNRVPDTVIATWAMTPSITVPELVRDIAGRFVAAFLYRRNISGNDSAVDPYANQLYMEAQSLLEGIIDGTLVIPEVPPEILLNTNHLSEAMFYPNNTTIGTDNNPSSTGNGSDIRFRMCNDF